MRDSPVWSVDLPTVEATEAFGEAFARVGRPPLVIVLDGDLGAGKTTWVRAVLRAWGWTGPVRSPTYTLHETYDCATIARIHHLDLYRLAAPDELAELGLADLWTVPAVCGCTGCGCGGDLGGAADMARLAVSPKTTNAPATPHTIRPVRVNMVLLSWKVNHSRKVPTVLSANCTNGGMA